MEIRPVTTLFMLASVDGKISTGAGDALDMDADLPLIPGVREGLRQYYDIEQTTDLWSLNSGRVQAKLGVNTAPMPAARSPVSFVLLDNTHLTAHGVEYFAARSQTFVLVTQNPAHPAFSVHADNLRILCTEAFSAARTLETLYAEYGCKRLTIQSGGTLNGIFAREKLLDYIDVVIAPLLVGGKDTPTLIDGAAITSRAQLPALAALRLESAQTLNHSYVRLRYRVVA